MCGLRRGEAFGLTWEAVDLEDDVLTIKQSAIYTSGKFYIKKPKSRAGIRKVAMPEIVAETLRKHKAIQAQERLLMGMEYQNEGWVMARPDGSIWKPGAVTIAHCELIKDLDVTYVTFHDLRHSHAAFLIAENTHMKVVSERLGHSSIAITMDTYDGHLLPKSDRKAADSLKGVFSGKPKEQAKK